MIRSGFAALVLAVVVVACTGGRLQPEDLPERPIAFLYWTDKGSQKRSEVFAKMAEVPPIPEDQEDPERMEEMKISAYLRGDEMLQIQSALRKHPGRLMLIWPRTGELERIEAAPIDAMPLSFSPDGKRLLISSHHRGEKEQLYEYHLERRDLSPVTRGRGAHPRGDYDAQGNVFAQRVERMRSRGASANTVHRLDSGGSDGPILADGVLPGTLRVMPGGDRIVYEQIRSRPRHVGSTVYESMIAIRSLARGAEEEILLRGREPALTPDGRWIVFASPSSAGYRLRRMRPDGTARVPIGPGGTEERMPAVSPDGEFIAFVQFAHGRRRLAVRRFDGKDERVLLPSGWSEFPTW